MLPQFELQAKRRMHAKRRRQEQRQKVALVIFSVTCLLAILIFFNIYYIYRNQPTPSNSTNDAESVTRKTGTSNKVRRRDPWIAKDAQPFVSYLLLLRL